jgi:hypothetical protein
MAYFPFFRGKQNELIAIRESASLLSRSNFVPVIEPVKKSTSGLLRAVESVSEAGGNGALITNPKNGDHKRDFSLIDQFFEGQLSDHQNIHAGFILDSDTSIDDAIAFCDRHNDRRLTFIHAGFSDASGLVDAIGIETINGIRHIFWDGHFGKLYQRHFRQSQKIILKDGFTVRPNRKHPGTEFFSDLHITYQDENMQGFGDFLIVGQDYSESGGPAYAVAIHITFIDPAREDAMFISHFVSDRRDTPTDPAGKFAEALQKLSDEMDNADTPIFRGNAIEEFLDLHRSGHYPGLGYVKKLSMCHHLETLSNYFANQ